MTLALLLLIIAAVCATLAVFRVPAGVDLTAIAVLLVIASILIGVLS